MSLLSRHREEAESQEVPDGYVPLPRSVIDDAVPKLVECGDSVLLVGRPALWALLPTGVGLGPPGMVTLHRDGEVSLELDEVMVVDVGRPPAGVRPDVYIRGQLEGWRHCPSRLGRAKVWRVGTPFPVVVEPEPVVAAPQVRGLEHGRPLDHRTGEALRMNVVKVCEAAAPRTIMVVNPDPQNLLGWSTTPPAPRAAHTEIRNYPWTWGAYSPENGAYAGVVGEPQIRDRREFFILWPTHLAMAVDDIERIRVSSDRRVVWCLWRGESKANWPGWQNYLSFVQVES